MSHGLRATFLGIPCSRCAIGLFLCIISQAGCPRHGAVSNQSLNAKKFQDSDAAYEYYEKALKAAPSNAEYLSRASQYRLEASPTHVQRGRAALVQGELQFALAEFQRALDIDPSSSVAEQEIRTARELIGGANSANSKDQRAPTAAPSTADLAEGPPQMKPLSTSPINVKMSNDAKIVYDTIGKLAGLTVIFDPDFPARRITVELAEATIEQALDIVSLQAKAFWKPVTQNIIFVVPDQPQKRRDYEEQVVQTYYVSNATLPQDLTELVTGLRQLLDLKRIQQLNSQNTIVIRDTPDKLALAEKIIHDADNAKPEVVVQVEVLQARRDRVHQLGIAPDTTATVSFVNPDSSSSSSDKNKLPLNKLLSSGDYSVTLPGATVNALLTDSTTQIIQNPELRSVDGQPAKLRVGDRVPVATGSFQAGTTASINPLVNTQFQYIDVGVNADITPRIHPGHEVSLKVSIEVSSVTGTSTIGGIQQPIISQRKIEHDIRLKEGEVSILGGLFERVDTKTLNGWPGLAHIPLLRYLFSSDSTDHQENEVLIVLVPRIVRLPALTQAALRPIGSGTESNVQVRRKESMLTPVAAPAGNASSAATSPQVGVGGSEAGQTARVHFEPEDVKLRVGQVASVDVVVDKVRDLFALPLLLQYDPQVVSIEEVHHGGFLSGRAQDVAIVERVDKEHGQAIISVTRQPNTVGVSGSGTLISIVVRAIAAGSSKLSIVQVNARDSQQKQIPVLTGEAVLHVKE
jgi:general secretion pathway protein D